MKTSLYNQIILKISEIEKILNEGKGYNPYRDAKGRFATSRVHDNDTAKILAKTRHYSKNLVGEVMFWTDVQKDVTTLWKKRGITWGELDKPKFLEYAKNRPTYHEWKNKKH